MNDQPEYTPEQLEEEHRRSIETMRDFVDSQDEPKVGIFWYDRKTNSLFGVAKVEAMDLAFNHNGMKTIRTLHKALWKKELMKKNPLFRGDYTLVPRGRIFEAEDRGFQIKIGSWIKEPWAENVIDLVTTEFDLQQANAEVVIDYHWDIGQGLDDLEF